MFNVAMLLGGGGGGITASVNIPADHQGLNQTMGTPTTERIWTYSFWFKSSVASGERHHLHDGSTGSNILRNENSGTFTLRIGVSGANDSITFGPSVNDLVWHHIVLAVDSTQATAADRLKIWLDGNAIAYSGTLTLNRFMGINKAGQALFLATDGAGVSNDFQGVYFNPVFVDGQQLAHTDFGFDDAGTWSPIAYEGTYGNNGFNLDFADSGSLGLDVSGNGNNFTAEAALTQSTDIPPS